MISWLPRNDDSSLPILRVRDFTIYIDDVEGCYVKKYNT